MSSNLESFRSLGISELTLAALAAKGFEQPSPIQQAAIPLLLSGCCDVIAQAQTGTGKTAAFGIPIIETVTPGLGHVQAVILSPTRELTVQISDEMNSLKGERNLIIAPVFGGQSIELQLRRLAQGVDIVIGTPGRVMDLMRRQALDLKQVTFAVLDEADEMLNMGFLEDMESILAETPADKRMLMFSATMPEAIMNIAAKFMREYELITVANRQTTVSATEQVCYEVRREQKFDALTRIIDMELNMYGMIFCRTKSDVDELAARLNEHGYGVEALHGDLAQAQRSKVIDRFKRRKFSLLIATDVAARGIDVNDLTHVINYSIPQTTEAYVHRIGRTGRAGKTGKAVTFVTPSESKRLAQIRRELKIEVRKERMPSPEDMVKRKKERALGSLNDIIAKEMHLDYLNFAEELLEKVGTVELVSAILRMAFKKELLPESYVELESEKGRGRIESEKGEQVRLFVAAGKMDGLSPGKILDLIWEKTGIRSRYIGKIDCLEKFSFINVNAPDAEKLVKAFRNFEPGRPPFMEVAREDSERDEHDAPAMFDYRGKEEAAKFEDDSPEKAKKKPKMVKTENFKTEKPRTEKSKAEKPKAAKPKTEKFKAKTETAPVERRPRKLSAPPEPPPDPKNRVRQKTEKKKKGPPAPPPAWVAKRTKKGFGSSVE
jgi:ATP-dependent RNA helicase DeaD